MRAAESGGDADRHGVVVDIAAARRARRVSARVDGRGRIHVTVEPGRPTGSSLVVSLNGLHDRDRPGAAVDVVREVVAGRIEGRVDRTAMVVVLAYVLEAADAEALIAAADRAAGG